MAPFLSACHVEITGKSLGIDESVRRRFEADWLAGNPQSIDHYLPPSSGDDSLGTLEELVIIEMEFLWKSGQAEPPLLEHYLRRFPQLDRQTTVVRLLMEECRIRRRFGQRPAIDEYLARFPELATELSSHFRNAETVDWAFESRSADEQEEQPPQIAGYAELKFIARGEMGLVLKARHLALDRWVAIKMPLARYVTCAEVVRESRSLAPASGRFARPLAAT